ncbi:Phospholipase-like protein [Melia azedarach]|uniref:Phospholipase-like protein n=1 Tax=Melia azedarach TaxID=155640 RepID=A0ACC1XWV3_MELAZ|nr:Phospholipase-like protein [Melia azedarach]
MATENGRVHPNCANASNPYHECGMACLEKIAQGQGQKEPKKKFDYHNGVKEDVISKKKNGERKVHPNCPKASNPFHECGEHCSKRNGEADPRGVKKESGSWSFGRKKKEYDSQPTSPRIVDKAAVGVQHHDAQHARAENHTKQKSESANNESFSSSEHYSKEIHSEDHSFKKEQVQSTQSVPQSANIKMTDKPKDPPKENVTSPISAPLTKNEKDDKPQASLEIHHDSEDVRESIVSPVAGSTHFSFSGRDLTPGDSDEEEAQSVISDSCVSVGKYHVRANVSSTLQSILNKYGDIAANCKLESNSMRAYYLECLCSVVQELQSISFSQMTKAKVREMLAVLKDVESAQIDVDWLRNILNEISDAIEFTTHQQTIEAAKANSDNLLEATRKELESQMKELALKEKEAAELKAHVYETKARLSELEFESSHLEQTIQSTQSKVEKFSHKSLADELL